MSDDLTRVIAEALDRRHHLNTADLAAAIADSLAPLIEARVDELERVRAKVRRWESELDSRCPSCGVDALSGCDHLEGYHHALSDMRTALRRDHE